MLVPSKSQTRIKGGHKESNFFGVSRPFDCGFIERHIFVHWRHPNFCCLPNRKMAERVVKLAQLNMIFERAIADRLKRAEASDRECEVDWTGVREFY
jgi:hypothetical protein